jgi:hypothetical protein
MRFDAVPSPRIEHLKYFDGFPYLVTRVVSALYHIIPLPAGQPTARYESWLNRQEGANRLETCLVMSKSSTLHADGNGKVGRNGHAPTGGIIVTRRLAPCETYEPTPDLVARCLRLERFAQGRGPKEGYLFGDLTKGGRTAMPRERSDLSGFQAGGVPLGLDRCSTCNDWRGECLDPSLEFEGQIMQVHCRCENHNRCARCSEILYERRLNANYFSETDGRIWHVPGFCGLKHRCPDESREVTHD